MSVSEGFPEHSSDGYLEKASGNQHGNTPGSLPQTANEEECPGRCPAHDPWDRLDGDLPRARRACLQPTWVPSEWSAQESAWTITQTPSRKQHCQNLVSRCQSKFTGIPGPKTTDHTDDTDNTTTSRATTARSQTWSCRVSQFTWWHLLPPCVHECN